MKIKTIEDVNRFLTAIDECTGNVNLISIYGDNYNLKSKLSQYVAVTALLGEHGDELELFCTNKEDEYKLMQFLRDNPEIAN